MPKVVRGVGFRWPGNVTLLLTHRQSQAIRRGPSASPAQLRLPSTRASSSETAANRGARSAPRAASPSPSPAAPLPPTTPPMAVPCFWASEPLSYAYWRSNCVWLSPIWHYNGRHDYQFLTGIVSGLQQSGRESEPCKVFSPPWPWSLVILTIPQQSDACLPVDVSLSRCIVSP